MTDVPTNSIRFYGCDSSSAKYQRLASSARRQIDLSPLRHAGSNCGGHNPSGKLLYRSVLRQHLELPVDIECGMGAKRKRGFDSRARTRAATARVAIGLRKLRLNDAYVERDPGGTEFLQRAFGRRIIVASADGPNHWAIGKDGSQNLRRRRRSSAP